jgi:tetratricopeptide (TPR) repeat protein
MSRPATRPAPATRPTTSTPIRWAGDPDVRAARRRLERARQTLRAEPYHDAALRDAIDALKTLGRWRDALTLIVRLRELYPDDPDLLPEHAASLLLLGRTVEAIPLLREVARMRPDDAQAWFNLASAHQSAGHLQEARTAWDRAILLDPTPDARAQRGIVLLDLYAWEAAAADFDAVLEHQPDAADATLNLARALRALGRHADARDRLLSFLERHPRHIPTLNRLAAIAWDSWRTTPAANPALLVDIQVWCRRSLRIDPDQPDVQALLDEVSQAARDAQ